MAKSIDILQTGHLARKKINGNFRNLPFITTIFVATKILHIFGKKSSEFLRVLSLLTPFTNRPCHGFRRHLDK